MKGKKGEEQLTIKKIVIKNRAINLMKILIYLFFCWFWNCFLIITNSSYDYYFQWLVFHSLKSFQTLPNPTLIMKCFLNGYFSWLIGTTYEENDFHFHIETSWLVLNFQGSSLNYFKKDTVALSENICTTTFQ